MQCSNEAQVHFTKAKWTDERTKASDSINSKSDSWVLFERDLFHFDAPAFEHNKRDIAFKHILPFSVCSSFCWGRWCSFCCCNCRTSLHYRQCCCMSKVHSIVCYISILATFFLRPCFDKCVFFVCSRLFNINGNGSNVHTAHECIWIWCTMAFWDRRENVYIVIS